MTNGRHFIGTLLIAASMLACGYILGTNGFPTATSAEQRTIWTLLGWPVAVLVTGVLLRRVSRDPVPVWLTRPPTMDEDAPRAEDGSL